MTEPRTIEDLPLAQRAEGEAAAFDEAESLEVIDAPAVDTAAIKEE